MRLALDSLDSSCVLRFWKVLFYLRRGFCNSSSLRILQVQVQGLFSTSVFYLGCFEDLSRTFGLETGGNFPWVHHLRRFILARGSFSSWMGSLHVYFPVLGYCSLSSGPWNSASSDLRRVLCSGTLGRILIFMP